MQNRQRTLQNANSTSTALRTNGHSNLKERSLHAESTLSGPSAVVDGMFVPMASATDYSPTITRLKDSYVLALQASRRRPSTLAMYRRVLDGFTGFMAARLGRAPDLGDLTTDNSRAYLIWLQEQPKYLDHPSRKPTGMISPSTVNQHARCLRAVGNWLFMEGHTEEHPLRRLRLPKVPTVEMRPLSPDEVQQLLRSTNTTTLNGRRTAAMIAVLYDTGMRSGELVRLKLGDVDFQSGELHVLGKGEKERTVVEGRIPCEPCAAIWIYGPQAWASPQTAYS